MNHIDWQYMVTVFPTLIQYLPITIFMAIVSMVFAIIIGVVFALITKNRIPVLYQFAKLYISFFRAVPTLVQLFLIYFGLPQLFPAMTSMDALTAVIIGLSIKNSAYLAEIFRAALNSVDEGQLEACLSVGMTRWQSYVRIIFPRGCQKCHSSDGEYLYWTFKRNIACLYHWGGRNVCARENDCIGQL